MTEEFIKKLFCFAEETEEDIDEAKNLYNSYLKYEQDNLDSLERYLPNYKDNKTVEEKLNRFFEELYTGEQHTLEEIYQEYTNKATNVLKVPKKQQKTYEGFILWLLEHGVPIERRWSTKHQTYKLYTIGYNKLNTEEEQKETIDNVR